MPEATGKITWGTGAGEGLKIVTICSPDVTSPRAVLVSSQKPPVRYVPLPGETEDEFVWRVTNLAKHQSYTDVVQIFLSIKWRMVRVTLDD
jgi:hypothetical protein